MILKNRHWTLRFFWVPALLWAGSALVVKAATYTVPADFGTIQAAIDAAADFDTITVNPGIYNENLNFSGKAITLTSTDPNDFGIVQSTILDGSNPADPHFSGVVLFTNNEDQDSILTGFTIQNGSGQSGFSIDWRVIFDGANGDGGAVLCIGASPTITKNVFKNNTSLYGGGAIFCHNQASPEIANNTFIENTTVYYGGAIFCRINCRPAIVRNTFVRNSCGSLGGAIYLADHSDARIAGNWFESNSSTQLSGGAIYYFVSSNPIIANNIFWKNTARTTGSAMMVSGSTGEIFNNTFFENRVFSDSSFAATLAIYSNCLLANNIIMDSTGGGLFTGSGAAPVIQNNCFWNNSAGNYRGNVADQTGLSGNIAVDPVMGANLPNPFTAFELEPNSPCRDVGANLVQQLVSDIDGSPRVVGAGVDIGAQEFNAVAVPQDYATIQAAMNAASEGDTVLISPGFYQENLNFNGKNLVLRSLNPLEPNCVARTILDGGQNGRCFTLKSNEDKSSIIAGFTIQNGLAEGAFGSDTIYGGGIYIADNAGATILYNYIHNNTSRSYGGGIDTRHFTDTIIGYNRIEHNTTLERSGGGIHVGANAQVKIFQNKIAHNSTNNIHQGGGIYLFNDAKVDIVDNIVCNNTSSSGGGIYGWKAYGTIARNHIWGNVSGESGGGIGLHPDTDLAGPQMTIVNNLIEGNQAGNHGGGIWLQQGFTFITNNTIVGNRAAGTSGSGIALEGGADADIVNNGIMDNPGGFGIHVLMHADLRIPQVLSNDLWNNGAGNYGGELPNQTGSNNNLSADPLFVEAGLWSDSDTVETTDDFWVPGDYRIGWFSPCRDGGLSSLAPDRDYVGSFRPQFAAADIGAYELRVHDLTTTGMVDLSDMILFNLDWLESGPARAVDLNNDEVVNYHDFSILAEDYLED